MKLLLDMNLSPRWITTLTEAGFEAQHWSAHGHGNAPDIAIMAFAKAHDYVVITHDLDFRAILAATGGDKPSVDQIRADDLSLDAIGSQVVVALRQSWRRAHWLPSSQPAPACGCCRCSPGKADALAQRGPAILAPQCSQHPLRLRSASARARMRSGGVGYLLANSVKEEQAASFWPRRFRDMASFSRDSGAFWPLP